MNVFKKIEAWGHDKVVHILICFIIADFCTRVFFHFLPGAGYFGWSAYVFALFFGFGVAVCVGDWKESYDERKGGKWDIKDFCADAVGAVAGAVYATVMLLLHI